MLEKYLYLVKNYMQDSLNIIFKQNYLKLINYFRISLPTSVEIKKFKVENYYLKKNESYIPKFTKSKASNNAFNTDDLWDDYEPLNSDCNNPLFRLELGIDLNNK